MCGAALRVGLVVLGDTQPLVGDCVSHTSSLAYLRWQENVIALNRSSGRNVALGVWGHQATVLTEDVTEMADTYVLLQSS